MDRAAVMNRFRGAFLALPTSYHNDLSVNVDATVALPFLTTALASTSADICADRRRAAFDLSGREIILDGEAFPDGRFET